MNSLVTNAIRLVCPASAHQLTNAQQYSQHVDKPLGLPRWHAMLQACSRVAKHACAAIRRAAALYSTHVRRLCACMLLARRDSSRPGRAVARADGTPATAGCGRAVALPLGREHVQAHTPDLLHDRADHPAGRG